MLLILVEKFGYFECVVLFWDSGKVSIIVWDDYVFKNVDEWRYMWMVCVFRKLLFYFRLVIV